MAAPSAKPPVRPASTAMRSLLLGTMAVWGANLAVVKLLIEVMGEYRVMYAMDYPYQYVPDEVRWMYNMAITDTQKKKFFQTNAERWFKL